MAEKQDEDTWYNNFLFQKCFYEKGKEATTTVQWECTPMIDRPTFINGYVTGSEPREKQIKELEKKNTELRLKLDALEGQTPWKDIKDKSELIGKLTKAKELLRFWVNDFYDALTI